MGVKAIACAPVVCLLVSNPTGFGGTPIAPSACSGAEGRFGGGWVVGGGLSRGVVLFGEKELALACCVANYSNLPFPPSHLKILSTIEDPL